MPIWLQLRLLTVHRPTRAGLVQGHAGTIPMPLRRDPMVGAAEAILRIETICNGGPGQKDRPPSAPSGGDAGLVCTVGSLSVWPGSSNVVPGHVNFSIDIRWACWSTAWNFHFVDHIVFFKRQAYEQETSLAQTCMCIPENLSALTYPAGH